jgi:DNA polymerase-3 subunit gamma/tau
VDDIRNLIDQVRIPPQTGQYKVYIIDEVHMLSSAAFNAFFENIRRTTQTYFYFATTENIKLFQRYFLVVKYLISRELP